jgi:hypothetical protein
VRCCLAGSLVIVAGLLAASSAWPQAMVPKDQALTLVVDFADQSDYGQGALSPRAADAVADALSETISFKPIPTHQSRLEAMARRYASPPTPMQAQLLATELSADAIVTGDVLLCQVHEQQRTAHVVVEAKVWEIGGEEPLLTASGVGRAGWEAGQEALVDARVNEALSVAAKQIAQSTSEMKVLVGMVYLSLGGRKVMLDLGSVHGLRKGVEFRAYRQVYDPDTRLTRRELAGRLKVTNVDTDTSTARIISQTGAITTRDTVRAIVPPKAVPEPKPAPLAKPRKGRRGTPGV